ncbi:TPA: hypothetical protein EYP83_01600 [Candidatus Geothermarchaeota archaeon]|nr:hypothetical protein [Candidatus Geothermarchaeota archaeon]
MKGRKYIWIALGISLTITVILALLILYGPNLNLDSIMSLIGEVQANDGGDKIPDRRLVGVIGRLLLG